MAVRITTTQLKNVIEVGSLTDPELSTHINVASNLVDVKLVGKGLSDTTLEHIELYLSAHYVALRNLRGNIEGTVGETTERLPAGEGFKLTTYGQQALALDSTGILAALGKQRAQFRAFGHTPTVNDC